MRTILLTFLTMVAFASNSVLNRLAVGGDAIDPSSFAIIRVCAGAITLYALVIIRGRNLSLGTRDTAIGAISLSAYMIGFSLAYLTLDAGLGALILFGTVQVSMFGWSAAQGSGPSRRQLAGAIIAFAGLLVALWPNNAAAADMSGALYMILAGVGWAAYTLAGRAAEDPLASTAGNFLMALPLLLLLLIGSGFHASAYGVALAVLSGAVTSGLGYALWYHILPMLTAQTAAVVQLSVPIIAIAAGAALLNEAITLGVLSAAALVVGGIALAVTAPKPQAGRS